MKDYKNREINKQREINKKRLDVKLFFLSFSNLYLLYLCC